MNYEKGYEIKNTRPIQPPSQTSKIKLHCLKGDHRTSKILILLTNIKHPKSSIDLKYLDPETYNNDKSFKILSPHLKSPVLEEDRNFSLFETNSILRYIAKKYQRDTLLGTTLKETALVDQWLEYISNELDPLLQVLYFPYVNLSDFDERQTSAFSNLKEEFELLEKRVKNKRFLVGYGVSLADISLIACLMCPFGAIFKRFFRPLFPALAKWVDFICEKIDLRWVDEDFKNLQCEVLEGDFDEQRDFRSEDARLKKDEKKDVEIREMKSDIKGLKEKMLQMEGKMENMIKIMRMVKKDSKKNFELPIGISPKISRENSPTATRKSMSRKQSGSGLYRKPNCNPKHQTERERSLHRENSQNSHPVSDNIRNQPQAIQRPNIFNKTPNVGNVSTLRTNNIDSEFDEESTVVQTKSSVKFERIVRQKSTLETKEYTRYGDENANRFIANRAKKTRRISENSEGMKSPPPKKKKIHFEHNRVHLEDISRVRFNDSGKQHNFSQKSDSYVHHPIEERKQEIKDYHGGKTSRRSSSIKKMEQSVKNVFQNSQESISYLDKNNFTNTFGGLESSLDEKLHMKTREARTITMFTAKPVIMQSYKSIDMNLLELRASINAAEGNSERADIIDEFVGNHPDDGFFEIKLSNEGMKIDLEDVDAIFRPILKQMITADVCDIGEKDCIVGCLFFGENAKIEKISNKFLTVSEINLSNFSSQEKILGALQHVMRTPKVSVR